MLPQNLLLVASALSLASAGPLLRKSLPPPPPAGNTSGPLPPTGPPTPAEPGVLPTLPETDGATTQLPAASGKFVRAAVGHGIQNYTCPEAGGSPSLVGALAVLYDVTALYPGSGPGALDMAAWTDLASTVLRDSEMPLNAAAPASSGAQASPFAASAANPFKPDVPLTVGGLGPIPVVGHHLFDAAGVPTFDLFAAGEKLACAKVGGVKAPKAADRGLLDTGAVDWLYLTAKDGAGSVGLTSVYRVNTAGGNPLTCETAGQTFSVPYGSQYWFYS